MWGIKAGKHWDPLFERQARLNQQARPGSCCAPRNCMGSISTVCGNTSRMRGLPWWVAQLHAWVWLRVGSRAIPRSKSRPIGRSRSLRTQLCQRGTRPGLFGGLSRNAPPAARAGPAACLGPGSEPENSSRGSVRERRREERASEPGRRRRLSSREAHSARARHLT